MLNGCGLLGGGTEKQLARAEAALQSGKYAEAAITLHNIVDDEPGNPAAQLLLARAQFMRGDAAGVEQALKNAEAAGADTASAAEMRARLAMGLAEFNALLNALDSGQYALSERVAQLYRARAYQGLGRPVEALAIYNKLLESWQGSADLHVFAAECHAELGRTQLALQHIEQALTLQQNSASAWRLRAALLARDSESARAALQKAIQSAPGQLTVPEQLALIAPEFQRTVNRLEVDAASALLKRLLDTAPESPITQWASGELKLISGELSEARSSLQTLVQEVPDFAPARPALIGALLAVGSFELAIQESTALVGKAPDDQRPRGAQQAIKQAADAGKGTEQQILQSVAAALILEQVPAARWMLEQGVVAYPDSEPLELLAIQQEQAAGQARRALERASGLASRAPKNQSARTLLAALQAANDDHIASQRSYEELWRETPNRAVALALAQSRLHTGQGDPLEPLRQWLAKQPDDLIARTGLASAAMELKRYDVATREYERIIEAAPTNALALNNLAWLYSKRADKRALAIARRAYEAADSAEIADTYGWLLAQAGDVKTARALLERAARGAPGNPEIRFHFAAVLARSATPEDVATARLWLMDLLSVSSNEDWRSSAEQLLVQLSTP